MGRIGGEAMAKVKPIEKMSLSELLDLEVDEQSEYDYDEWMHRIYLFMPFYGINERLDEIEKRLAKIEQTQDKLRKHKHAEGEVVTKI